MSYLYLSFSCHILLFRSFLIPLPDIFACLVLSHSLYFIILFSFALILFIFPLSFSVPVSVSFSLFLCLLISSSFFSYSSTIYVRCRGDTNLQCFVHPLVIIRLLSVLQNKVRKKANCNMVIILQQTPIRETHMVERNR